MSVTTPAIDMRGREISVGDIIAYALTAGRSANLATYRVEEIVEVPSSGHYIDPATGKSAWGLHVAKKLRVRKLTQSYGGKQESMSTIGMANERALVINESAALWPQTTP